ncbi:hypothetical protein BP6252_10961 [Coleophoma cylindrospora]|uniref:Apple domain-containing protein n=1 Tax=Coleophoma cylindrospora TaxID=1849047 RepID=A0A3D8QNK6_9HELO|nr:hypothetical protein BP6252_10961 [Coleophoma cylindrospora]
MVHYEDGLEVVVPRDEGLEVVSVRDEGPCVQSIEDAWAGHNVGHNGGHNEGHDKKYDAPKEDKNSKYLSIGSEQTQTSHDPLQHKEEVYNARKGRICGLSRVCFWIVLAVAATIIVAGAVGGGLGAGLSKKSTSSHSLTTPGTTTTATVSTGPTSTAPTSTVKGSSTSTSTTSSATPYGTDIAGCPGANGTSYTSSSSTSSFLKLCNQDYHDPTNGYTINIADTSNPSSTTSLNSCIDSCVAYNTNNNAVPGSGGCVAAVIVMSTSQCWLKNSTGLHVDTAGQYDIAAGCMEGYC